MHIKELMVGATEKIGDSYIKAEVRADIFPGEDMDAVREELVNEVNKAIEAQAGGSTTKKAPVKKSAPKKKEDTQAESKPNPKPEPQEESQQEEETPVKKKAAKKKTARRGKPVAYDRTIDDHKERIAEILDDCLPGWRVKDSEEKTIAGKVSQAVVGADFLEKGKVLPTFIEKVVTTVDECRGV